MICSSQNQAYHCNIDTLMPVGMPLATYISSLLIPITTL